MVDRLIAGLDHRGHEIVEKNNPAKGRAWCLPIPVASQRRIRSRLAERYELERKRRRRGAAAESGYALARALPTRLVPEQRASSQIRGNP